MKLTPFRQGVDFFRSLPRSRPIPSAPPSAARRSLHPVDDAGLTDARDQALLTVGRILQDHRYRFTTVTPDTHAIVLAREDGDTGRPVAAHDLRDVFGWNRSFEVELLPVHLMAALRNADAVETLPDGRLRARIRFATVGNALFLHAGFPTTAPDAVFFGPDTYRFIRLLRQQLTGGRSLIEIGGGSGAAAWCLADRFSTVAMTDINPAALRFARINAALNGVQADVRLANLLDGAGGPFDAIIANPPYLIDPAGRIYRDGGEDGIGVALAMVDAALPRLADDGTFVLYSGAPIVGGVDRLWAALSPMLATCGKPTRYEELDADVFGSELALPHYAHVERIAVVSLIVGAAAASIPASTHAPRARS